MATRNISIRDEVYKKLREAKREDESFSDTIERLLERKTSVMSFAGVFEPGDKELKIMEEEIKRIRKSAKIRVTSV